MNQKPIHHIYTRFSPRRNEDTCESCDQQFEFCTAWLKRNERKFGQRFDDAALSGADYERPGLWSAIALLGRGDVLVVYKFDRLARDAYLAMTIERDVLSRGASIISASGEGTIDKSLSPDEQFKIAILRAANEYERRIIGVRTKVAMIRHQRTGRRMSDQPPYGFASDPENPARLISLASEQNAIKSAQSHQIAGKGLREICRLLQSEGHTCRGKHWHHSTVSKMLARAI